MLVVGLLVGIVGCFLVLKPQLTATQSLDQQIAKENQELQTANTELTYRNKDLSLKNADLKMEQAHLSASIENLNKSFKTIQDSANQSAEAVYELSMSVMQESLSNEADKMSEYYQKQQDEYIQEYTQTLKELTVELQSMLNDKNKEISAAAQHLSSLEAKAQAATEAAKREQEKLNSEKFYKLDISSEDLEEIRKLRQVAQYLRNQEPLNKVIWKTYYEKAYTDLMGRIINNSCSIGIYKITNSLNQMIYIGQSVNLKDRLKTHIKAGLGIDSSNNKLYTAMKHDNVENFTFEIMEYCKREELNEKEKYWIKFYSSDSFGYNMTIGNVTKEK